MRWLATPAIREAARRVGERIAEVEHNPARDRHDLRWMECLSDELRLSLEQSWGYQPGPERRTAIGEKVSDLPKGCTSGPGKTRDVPRDVTVRSGGEPRQQAGDRGRSASALMLADPDLARGCPACPADVSCNQGCCRWKVPGLVSAGFGHRTPAHRLPPGARPAETT